MAHKTVVRNMAYQTKSFTTVERHNERKNEEYFNGDVELERAKLNVYFKRNFREDGTVESYQETFNRLLAEKKAVIHGTQADAKLFCEFVYAVNTSYFDEHGGYEFAKKYFAEAYRQALKEIGGDYDKEYGEQLVISAVMHADERNARLSEQLGRDVYHYHLHVVYVPVVMKEKRFRKDHKDPEKAGKIKEIIPQISQSNKWPMRQKGIRDGKEVTLNSYSFLQDRYYEHMKQADFDGFERGEFGSTAEHLEVLDCKIQQDRKHAAALEQEIEEKQSISSSLDDDIGVKHGAVAELDLQIQQQESTSAENTKRIAAQEKKIKSLKGKVLSVEQIDKIPVKISKPMLGGDESATMPKKDWDNIKKTALTQSQTAEEYKATLSEDDTLKKQRTKLRKDNQGLENEMEQLRNSTNEKFLERATREAELHNLKNDVAKIPADVWNMYTNPKSHQQRISRQEVR